nr:MAG TPA: integrase repeat unit protein [Caudoviricetes sp.]
MKTAEERQKEIIKINSDLHDFLKEKGLTGFDCMRVKRTLGRIKELDRERDIYYNDEWKGYEGYSISGKNNVFETYEEAQLVELLERMFLPEEMEKKQVSQKIFEVVSIIYKLTDYKSKYFEFKLKDNENSI